MRRELVRSRRAIYLSGLLLTAGCCMCPRPTPVCVEATDVAECGQGAVPAGAGQTWLPHAKRPTTARALDICGEHMSKENFKPLVGGFDLPPIDTVSGILKHKDMNIPLPSSCGMNYRNLRSSGTALLMAAQAECAVGLISSACTSPAKRPADPAETLRKQLAQVQEAGLALRAALDEVSPESIFKTQGEICKRLDAVARSMPANPKLGVGFLDMGTPLLVHDSLSERVSTIESVLGAELRRGAAERAVLASRAEDLERRSAKQDLLIERLLTKGSATKACLDEVRQRSDAVRVARREFYAAVDRLGFLSDPFTSLFAAATASTFDAGAFDVCQSEPNQATRDEVNKIAEGMLTALREGRELGVSRKRSSGERGFAPVVIEVEVIGYADQNPLLDRLRCGAHVSNYDLALSRAKAIAGIIDEFFENKKVRAYVVALGDDKHLVRDCNWEKNSDDCSAKNRRFEVRFWAPRLTLELPRECELGEQD